MQADLVVLSNVEIASSGARSSVYQGECWVYTEWTASGSRASRAICEVMCVGP